MLDFACASCAKRKRLNQLAAWLEMRPVCSTECRNRLEVRAPAPLEEHVAGALVALDACRDPLEQSIPLAFQAAAATHRADALAANARAPGGLLSGLALTSEMSEMQRARDLAQANLQLIGAHVFELEQHLAVAVCRAMGLHAAGVPVVQGLMPLAGAFTLLIVDPPRMDPRQLHAELLGLHTLLGGLHAQISGLRR